MRALLAIGLSVLLSGCGLSNPIIKSETVSFDDVIEDTSNKLLVLNILRARDQAPLHFMAIPSIRLAMQQTTSLSLLEFLGARSGSTQRNSATLGLGLQMSPSFDVNHVYSKEFVTGMTSPIDPKFVKYWVDRGLDRRMVLLLFFSAAEITKTGKDGKPIKVRVTNTPKESIDEISNRMRNPKADACVQKSQFERFLSLTNRFWDYSAQTHSKRELIGCLQVEPGQSAKFLQALAAAEQSKLKYKYVKSTKTYKLYATAEESQMLFCYADELSAAAVKGIALTESDVSCAKPPKDDDSDKECYPPAKPAALKEEADSTASDSQKSDKKPPEDLYCKIIDDLIGNPSNSGLKIQLQIRSVGEMIHFLGDLLYYQEALRSDPTLQPRAENAQEARRHDLHNPVTLGYCPQPPEVDKASKTQDTRGRWDILFDLGSDTENARFAVPYRDKLYAVGNYRPAANPRPIDKSTCEQEYVDRKDHTLQVLSVVNQLINLHQSATEVRSTPFVQVLP